MQSTTCCKKLAMLLIGWGCSKRICCLRIPRRSELFMTTVCPTNITGTRFMVCPQWVSSPHWRSTSCLRCWSPLRRDSRAHSTPHWSTILWGAWNSKHIMGARNPKNWNSWCIARTKYICFLSISESTRFGILGKYTSFLCWRGKKIFSRICFGSWTWYKSS